MAYKVIVSRNAIADLAKYINYLLVEKQSRQAAVNTLNDYEETLKELEVVAGSLKILENPKLSERGLRRINFRRHNYFILYFIEDDTAVVTNVFHSSEDFENKMN